MARTDRRDSFDEVEQKNIIKQCCKEIAEEFKIFIDLSDFDKISRGKESKYFSHKNGKLICAKDEKRNPYKDSKTMDAVVYVRNKYGVFLNIYFFCKYTKESGGEQYYIPFEIEVTQSCILKNSNKNSIVCFMLEGNFWNINLVKQAKFDNNKTYYVNRYNMKNTIIDILKEKGIIF